MDSDVPGMSLPDRQGIGRTPQSTVGAERLLRAIHTWVGDHQQGETWPGAKEGHLE